MTRTTVRLHDDRVTELERPPLCGRTHPDDDGPPIRPDVVAQIDGHRGAAPPGVPGRRVPDREGAYPSVEIARYMFVADVLCATAGPAGAARPGRGEGAT